MGQIRGVDIVGQGVMQGLGGFWDNLAKVLAENRRQSEVGSIVSGLQQGAQPTSYAPQGGIQNPDGTLNPLVGSGGIPALDERNFAALLRLGELTGGKGPELLHGLQNRNQFIPGFRSSMDVGTITPSGDAYLTQIRGPMPERQSTSRSYTWTTNSPEGGTNTEKIPGTNATRVYEYAVDPETNQYVPGPSGAPIRRLASGGSMPMAGGSGAGKEIPMTPEAMDFAYNMFKTNGELPKSGMGVAGTISAWKFYDYAEKRARSEGIPAAEFAAQKAKYATAKMGLGAVQKMKDTAIPVARASNGYLDLVEKQLDSGYQPPTSSPLANEYIQWAKDGRLNGNPEFQAYKNYIFAAVRDYAKVITGSHGSVAGLSDFATKNVEDILNVMQSPAMARKSIETMRADLKVVVDSWTDAARELRQGMGIQASPPGGFPPVSGGGSGPRPGQVEDGFRFKGGDPSNPANWEKVP